MHVVSWCTRRLAPLTVAGALVLVGAGCAAHTKPVAAARTAADSAIGAAPQPDPPVAPPADQVVPSAPTGNTNAADRNPRPSTGTTTTTKNASASASTAPVVGYFRVRQQPKCKGSSGQGPIIPLIVEWQVTGADTVTVSEDGSAKSYPATGSETYVFGCAGPAGTADKHTYTLKAQHDGAHTTRSLTASAVVN